MLKAVIFSLRNVLAQRGVTDSRVLRDTIKLLKFLRKRGVEPVFLSNHNWKINVNNKGEVPFQSFLEEHIGPVRYYVGGQSGVPNKPTAAVTQFILSAHSWKPHEVMYVGNTPNDMITARNGKLLFLNALWHGEATQYGYQFSSPSDVARFIDCICLGLDDWYWKVEDDSFRVYAMAPYATLSPGYRDAHVYSANAKAVAKRGQGDIEFWGRLLAARVYLSGLAHEIDYVTAYPGHSPASEQTVIEGALNVLGQSIASSYIPDLIIRHTKATQSHSARASNKVVGIDNQLKTIRLNPTPRKGALGKLYTRQPVKRGKTVLLVDDICTEGHSFEAGRAFLEALGANVICLSWLKTVNRDYKRLAAPIENLPPYSALQVSNAIATKPIWFSSAVNYRSAPTQLDDLYRRYCDWDWSIIKV